MFLVMKKGKPEACPEDALIGSDQSRILALNMVPSKSKG
jgi:hypothetical protein